VPEYEVQGTGERIFYDAYASGNTNATRRFTCTFSVVIQECGYWQIALKLSNTEADEIRFGCAGDAIYMSRFLKSKAKQVEERTGKHPLNTGICTVAPGPVPYEFDVEEVTILWYAFASKCFLEERERKRIRTLPLLLVESPTAATAIHLFPAEMDSIWTRCSASPFVLLYLNQRSDGYSRFWVDSDNGPMLGPPAKRKYPGAAGAGFSAFEFKADELFQQDGLTLPKKLHFDWYEPQNNAGRTIYRQFKFQVTNSFKSQSKSFIPEVPGIATVADMRFFNRSPAAVQVLYVVTNEWLGLDQVKQDPGYTYAVGRQRTAPKRVPVQRPKQVKIIFWAVGVTSFIICLWVIVAYQRQPTK
jgi:hypothetical protein